MIFKKKFRFNKKVLLFDDTIWLSLRSVLPAEPEKGYLPTYYFDIIRISDQAVVGRCDLRIGHNTTNYYAGNIGYCVKELFRGNGYALHTCFLLERLARTHGMKKMLITCDPDNLPSKLTCERFGARYIDTVLLPEDNEMYQAGSREKRVYEKILK